MLSKVRKFYWAVRIALQEMDNPSSCDFPDQPDLFKTFRIYASNPQLKRKPGGWLYKDRFYPDYLTVGGASHAIFRVALMHCSGKGIDVGAGLWPLPGAQPVDVWRGPGAGSSVDDFKDGSQDYVFSSHCLEHIADWQAELRRWVGKIRPGGIIFLYLPHPSCGIWEPGSPMVGDGHVWAPSPEILKHFLQELGCEPVAADDGPDAMMSFHICMRRNLC